MANIGIVVTAARCGHGVGAGLPHLAGLQDGVVGGGELGAHGVIEFGDRMLTLVLAAVAIATSSSCCGRGRGGGRA